MVSRVAQTISQLGYRPRGIVHVGGHGAQEMASYLALEPALIVWIEADPAHLPRLQEAVRDFRAPPRQIVIQALIADTDGRPLDFHRFSNRGQASSLFHSTERLRGRWPDVRETGEVLRLNSARLDTVLHGAGVTPDDVDVLVLDVQGAELMALTGVGAYLDHVEFVEAELSQEEIYEGAPKADAVEAAFTDLGFERLTKLRWHGGVVFRRQQAE